MPLSNFLVQIGVSSFIFALGGRTATIHRPVSVSQLSDYLLSSCCLPRSFSFFLSFSVPTSISWVSELIPKVRPASALPFIWVGIRCQAQRASLSPGLRSAAEDRREWQTRTLSLQSPDPAAPPPPDHLPTPHSSIPHHHHRRKQWRR